MVVVTVVGVAVVVTVVVTVVGVAVVVVALVGVAVVVAVVGVSKSCLDWSKTILTFQSSVCLV